MSENNFIFTLDCNKIWEKFYSIYYYPFCKQWFDRTIMFDLLLIWIQCFVLNLYLVEYRILEYVKYYIINLDFSIWYKVTNKKKI